MNRNRFSRWSGEVVFYPWRNGVFVSNVEFCAHGKTYRVGEMTRPVRARGSARAARVVAGQTIVVETVLSAFVAAAAPSVVAALVVVGYLVVVALTLWITITRWPAPRQLWVAYRGTWTMIYTSTDETEFGKVSRALVKAIESNQGLAA